MSAPAAPHRWIYEYGGTASGGDGGGGQPPIPGVPPATNLAETHVLRNNDLWEVDVSFKVPGATKTNWAGVAIYVEDPDISNLKGSTRAPGLGQGVVAGQSNLSGVWQPLLVNNITDTPANAIAGITTAISIPTQDVLRSVRIYVCCYGPNQTPNLVRANDPTNTPTPSITVQLLPQQAAYVSGMEVAWLVSDVSVTVNTEYNQVPPLYTLTYGYLPPNADEEAHRPPGVNPFGGVAIWYRYSDTGAVVQAMQHPYVQNAQPVGAVIKWNSTEYQASKGSYRVYFVSTDIYGSQNTIVDGITPSVDVSIDPTVLAPDVGNLQLVSSSVEYQLDGSFLAIATFSWTLPTDGAVRYAGMNLYRVAVTGSNPPLSPVPLQIWSQTSSSDNTATVEVARIPAHTENWVIAAIAVDFNGQLADDPTNYSSGPPPTPGAGFHSPHVVWTVGPPGVGTMGGGQEYAPLVTLNARTMATPTETTSSDGVRMVSFAINGLGGYAWTNPTSNQFGGAWVAMVTNGDLSHPTYWLVPGNGTSFVTPTFAAPGAFGVAQTLDFYIVSQDPQGHRNTLVKGTTPDITTSYTPTEGAIIPSRFPPAWFNTSEFGWDPSSNTFTTQSIGANKIQVGSILAVGGKNTFGGSQNGQIGVFDKNQTLVGWIGTQQPSQGNGQNISGAWFYQLWVGGSQPAYAPLWVDNNGIVEVGGIAGLAGAPYPYISIRDAHGIEQGRIGAQLTNPSAPGDGGGANASNLPTAVTAGAWFAQLGAGVAQTATGGPNWQVLIANGTFQIRNTDLFQIDYAPNTTNPPYNQEYLIQFGKGVWAGAGLAGSYQFPGFLIYENDGGVPPNIFGSVFINRGIVLRGTATQGHRVIASFDMFNGDSQGSDFPTQFFGELVLYCPTNPAIMSVHLSSGYQNASGVIVGDSAFNMWDHNQHPTFAVDGAGDVTAAGAMTANSFNVPGWGGPVIDSQGNWKGNPITASGGVQTINAAGYGLLTGAVVFAGGANVTLSQSGSTITISSSGSGSGSQTPWTQNIDAHNNALNSPSAIRSYHMDPASPNYSGTGFQLLDVATGSLPGLAIYQDNGIIVAGAYDSNPATNIQPANFEMTGAVSPFPQRILLQTNLSSQDYPVIGVGFTDAGSPGYLNLFAYGAQGFFKQSTQLAWEIRNGKTGGVGNGNAGTLSGDIYLYNTSNQTVFSVSQGTVAAAGYSINGSPVAGPCSFVVHDGNNQNTWVITFSGGILTGFRPYP